LLLIVAAFTFVYSLTEMAGAPYQRTDPPENAVVETPDPGDSPDDPEDDPEDIPEDNPEDEPEDDPEPVFIEQGFISIELDEREIHQGYLLLVNHDHTYTIPNDLDLVRITEATTTNFRVQPDTSRLLRSIIEPLDEMMGDFRRVIGDRTVAIRSAYRNYDSQRSIFNSWVSQVGRQEALMWAALPGHSEHHTGLAFDFGILSSNGTLTTFTGTGNTSWFRRNSYKYGFILRYQQSKTRITQTANEPWHFRYVGLPHSALIHQKNWCLEEFIENIRDYTYEEPLEFEYDGVIYGVYFAEGTSIRIPINTEFNVSGNNIDGFIVTVTWQETEPDIAPEV